MSLSHSRGRFARLTGIGALLLAVLVSIVGSATPARADNVAQSLPFSQSWSNPAVITVNDSWAGVAGVEGYLGQSLTSATGADPQTLLAVSVDANDLDVIANQANPNTLSTGGVAEFDGIANPSIALNGSGTADAPYALFYLNTSSFQNISVAYTLRDLDGSADNAVQPVALQFRVGSSGNFTNVPAGFVADATSGPSLATQTNAVSAVLPAAANNQPLVQVRVITANAAGNDEWVGVDDIAVSGTPSGPSLPSVTLSVDTDVASEAAQTVVTVSANAAAPVTGAQSVSLAVAGTGISATDYALSSPTITIADGATTGSVSFTVVDDAEAEGSETATLTISSPSAGITLGATTSRSVTIADNDAVVVPVCEQPFTPIYAIQGSGSSAAITGNVTTQGVVVGDFETSAALQGFYLQDASGDGDSASSDGIFVFTGSSANLVSAGQLVRVTGFARERFNMTALNGADSNSAVVPAASVVSCGSGSVASVDVSLPIPSATYLEQFEGMLVRFPQALQISEYFNFDRFGELVLALPLDGEPRPFTGTAIDAPGADANARTAANNLRRITLDDGRGSQNPDPARHPNGADFTLSNRFRGGDQLQNTVGVLSFDFSLYRIQPTGPATYIANNPRPAAPASVGGRLKVGAFNTLNYFLTLDTTSNDNGPGPCGGNANLDCRGADSDQPDEFTRQRTKLLAAIQGINADVLGLIELENTPNVEPLQNIVAGLNAIPGVGPYAFIETGTIGTDAIKVGLIYKPGKVTPVGGFQVLDSTDDPNFLDTKNRPVLAQSFRENATGATFTVAVAHLKSKGSACTDVGDPDTGDGQANCNQTRAKAANALVKWLDTNPAFAGDKDFLIVGDLNAYAKEDPISEILAGPDDSLGTSDDYTNLILQYLGPFAYSYVFNGQAGYLDHALASASLTPQVTGATEWHINADEPDLLDYDTSFKLPAQDALFEPNAYRTSDHDPVLVGLGLTTPNTPPALVASATYDTGLGANGAEIVSVRGDRAVLSNALDGSVDILDTSDLLNIKLIQRVKIPELAGLTSVAIHPTKDLFVAVTGSSAPVRTGSVLIFRLSDGALLAQASIGRQPDSVEFAPDGGKAVIAIEAEQVSISDDGGAGAIGVLDVSGFDPASSSSISVSIVELPDLAGIPGISSGRTHGDAIGAPVSNTPGTIEPESIGFAADSQTVYVTLQENNAIARLDLAGALPATLPASAVFGLGQVNFTGDTSTSGGYNPVNSVVAFREPDGVRAVEIGGVRYLVTADEGDTRNAAGSNSVRGGRTLSIFNAATGALVADAGDQLSALANRYGLYPDSRSNRAATEPEMLDVATVGGRTIVAVSLERANAVAFVDISTPTAPLAFALLRTGNNPEGIKLLERNGQLFVLTANEVSGTLTSATVPVLPLNATTSYTEDTARSFGIGAIDFEGGPLTLSLTLSPASAGALSGTGLVAGANPGEYTASGTTATLNAALVGLVFTPAANFNGTATAALSLSDGEFTANGTLTFVGAAVNDAPVAVDDSFTTAEDTAVSGDVLTNDSDVDSASLTATLTSVPANGTLVFNPNGSFTYTPNANFNGVDGFTYTASDGSASSQVATVTITVIAVNDAPVANNDTATTAEDTAVTVSVLTNDSDLDGDTLTVSAVTQGASGSVAIVAGGVQYTPNANFSGADSFTYTVSDGNGGTATATVNVTVTPVNDAPMANNDTATTTEDTAVTVNVLANDSDVDGDTLTVSAVTQGASGSVAIVAGGVQYTPNANFNGADSFTYTVSDGNGGTTTATVNVTVTPVNDGPSIAQLAGTGACVAGNVASGSFRVAVGDSETAAGDLSVTTSSTNPLIGASVGGSGDSREVIFTVASSNQVQTGTVTLTVTDAGGAAATLTVRVGAGTNQANVIVGNRSQINVIFGLGGNDVLRGGGLGDLICGGNGGDLIIAGGGDDSADGGNGDDVVNGQGGADSLIGGNGGDLLSGGEGNDSLDGGSGGDVLFGESGDDTLTGGSGADLFSGGPGSDRATDYNRREGDVRLSIEL